MSALLLQDMSRDLSRWLSHKPEAMLCAREAADRVAAEKLARDLKSGTGYIATKVLPDGSVAALTDLIYTRAILLGCTDWGYSRRFCFKDREMATQRFEDLNSEDDEPQGYVARRP